MHLKLKESNAHYILNESCVTFVIIHEILSIAYHRLTKCLRGAFKYQVKITCALLYQVKSIILQ